LAAPAATPDIATMRQMMMRRSMMPVQNGDELKIGVFADEVPERQHQVIVITKRPHRG
jgi:hypothetical protein